MRTLKILRAMLWQLRFVGWLLWKINFRLWILWWTFHELIIGLVIGALREDVSPDEFKEVEGLLLPLIGYKGRNYQVHNESFWEGKRSFWTLPAYETPVAKAEYHYIDAHDARPPY